MNFEISVVAVGLAGKQRLHLPGCDFATQRPDGSLSLLHHAFVALFLAELDQPDIVLKSLRKRPDGGDVLLKRLALAHQLLGFLRIVPEGRILRTHVEVIEALYRFIPVKDASSAGLWPA